MSHSTDDLRIKSQRPLVSPSLLLEELPLSDTDAATVTTARKEIGDILSGRDDRLLVITGPCSIHDTRAAEEYATRLQPLVQKHAADLLVVMRVYFEKPRTVVGWKGLINDPFIDHSFHINQGLRMARKLLLDILRTGVPTATEFLDTLIPQFIADLVCYGAIGARTTESQMHRELASGLSMPVGFKNGTSGNVQMAVDAVCAAKHSHWFPSVTKSGVAAISETSGNEDAHIILRGGLLSGPNYEAKPIADAVALLEKAHLPAYLVVDCSHGNSSKDHNRQPVVAAELASQIAGGSRTIAGIMLESHLVSGRQNYETPERAIYGQSITDACISFEETAPILESLAGAVVKRRQSKSA
ncbi:MAG: 3-deoxy-7-phosphoheptulonate synthase [Puniceicoccales bacterium]|jgi:3-deoxy-7-phosphoheptulonate synthase|nr:3-deoxy-7-phosphoheptulonate synthase [Puniceicoccales bacterium]